MNVRRTGGRGGVGAQKPTDCYLRISRRHRRISGPIQRDKPLQLGSLFSTFPNINSNCSRRPPSAFQRDPVNVRIFLSRSLCCDQRWHHSAPSATMQGATVLRAAALDMGRVCCWGWWWVEIIKKKKIPRKVRVKARLKHLCLLPGNVSSSSFA